MSNANPPDDEQNEPTMDGMQPTMGPADAAIGASGKDETLPPDQSVANTGDFSPEGPVARADSATQDTGVYATADQETGEFSVHQSLDATGYFSHSSDEATGEHHAVPAGDQATGGFSLGEVSKPSEMMANQPGRGVSIPKLVGDYEIRSVLGRGGMGVVYRARHRKLGREVALKMVLAGAHASPDQLQRFIVEAQAVAHLQHPNIVQIFEVAEQGGLPYFSLEFVDGIPLDNRLKESMLDDREAAEMMATICLAMQYAHDNNILHRDLKPANILLTQDNKPKITDFGLAKKLEDEDASASTRTGTVMGTPSYMSPEQAMGQVKELGPATDQYSLGAMLYEFLTGRAPFIGAKPIDTIMQVVREEPVPPRQIRASCPIDLETICLKALQKEPQKRYASCADLAADLQRYLEGKLILARPVGQVEVFWRWCKRNPVVAGLCATAATLLIAIAGVSLYSANAVAAKNAELGRTNAQLADSLTIVNEQKFELEEKNTELGAAIAESTRRSERLQSYVQDVFRSINQLNILDVPRAKPFRNELLKKTLPWMDEIIAELPETAQAMPTKMAGLYSLAQSYRDQQMGAEAEATLMDLVHIAEGRVELKNGSDAARNNLTKFLIDLSQVRLELNRDFEASVQAAQRAMEIAEAIVANPKASDDGKGLFDPYRSKLLLADSVMNLAVLHYRIGDSAAAKPLFEKNYQIQTGVLSELPENLTAAVEQKIKTSQLARASVLFRSGDADAARPLYEDAVAQARTQLAADPTSPLLQNQMAGFTGMWGEYLLQTGEIEAGLASLQEAAKLAGELESQELNSVEFKRSAATAFYRLAQWHPDAKTRQEYGKRALQLRAEMMEGDPENTKLRIHWMNSMARSGPLVEAIKVADEFANFDKPDSEILLEVAKAFCQCAARCDSESRRSELLTQAAQSIKRAIDIGFRDVSFNQLDKDLAPLTATLDLQTLK